jgi:plasmid stabilization system protein ParE
VKLYKIQIDTDALEDIQNATDWYNLASKGLGTRFQKQVKIQINTLSQYPLAYGIRYSSVRGMLIKKFPFLVHFTVDETKRIVKIFAVFHTSRNPEIWKTRKK